MTAQELTDYLKQHFKQKGEDWAVKWLEEKPTIVNFECNGSCGTDIEGYNKRGERCIGCPTRHRKYRKLEKKKKVAN